MLLRGRSAPVSIQFRQRNPARALQLEESEWPEKVLEVVQFVRMSLQRHREGVGTDVHDRAAEDLDEFQNLTAFGRATTHSGQQQLALHRLTDLGFSDARVLRLLPQTMMIQHKVIPVAFANNRLTLAMVNPNNIIALDDIRRIIKGVMIEPVVLASKKRKLRRWSFS